MSRVNWKKVINRAIAELEWKDAEFDSTVFTAAEKAAAGEWPDCACGVQDPLIPRVKTDTGEWTPGTPKDAVLRDFGIRFYNAVEDGRPFDARALLYAIQQRSGEILEGIAKRAKAKRRKA